MMPPDCYICDKRLDPSKEGDLISFKESSQDRKDNLRLVQEGMTGHPANARWFCQDHLKKAKSLSYLTLQEANKQLKA